MWRVRKWANPAASDCISEGSRYEIRDTWTGQVSVCVLPNGRQVDAWDFFRTGTTG
ncbi:MAG: DUF333 domain-containing protein [Rhodobacteraceae bacterium]|nr:DUF333 domain-containing protein [Paracoccaceae bacterium]